MRLALDRFPLLLRVMALAAAATAPLWLLDAALGRRLAHVHASNAAVVAAVAARGVLALFAAAWAYAALAAATEEEPAVSAPAP
jgi:hypothetical protein